MSNQVRAPSSVAAAAPSGPLGNARRQPSHMSVSLKQDSRLGGGRRPLQCASQRSSDSSGAQVNRGSSGETSNVEAWFDQSNKEVSGNAAALNDSDSPFSFEDNVDSYPAPDMPANHRFLPHPTRFMMGDSAGSSSEEYRSVIDDLTIENKKLKKRLRRYERTRDSQTQKDGLFEVKVLGLPPDKRRELEETLRRFAANLDRYPNSAEVDPLPVEPGQFLPANPTPKPSSMSSTRLADSAYGSLATSARDSNVRSAKDSTAINNGHHRSNRFEGSQAKAHSIQSYLHDIPEGLLPRQSVAMSEKSRKRLVVRRLEQIFGGGRGAAPGLNQQSQQQQEVSQSAAKADRSNLEAQGRQAKGEGIREAQIMDVDPEDANEYLQPLQKTESSSEDDLMRGASTRDFAEKHGSSALPSGTTLEQRPTRPLDLDPHRPQVPSENIEYIRHLGFLDSETNHAVPMVDGQDWIYLNLLVNMAQLHTVNVTTDFVKDAISEYSSKIELSDDGRKVRWREEQGKMLVGDTTPESDQGTSSADARDDAQVGDKRARPAYIDDAHGGSTRFSKKQSLLESAKNQFAYTPLFAHESDSESESESDVLMSDADLSAVSQGQRTSSQPPGSGLSAVKRSFSSKSRPDSGPMIFYNNATFCSDLGAENPGTRRPSATVKYQSLACNPLGTLETKRAPSVQSSLKGSDYTAFDVSELSSSLGFPSGSLNGLELLSPRPSPRHVHFAEPEKPMSFEASGVGGVTPRDNITIDVVRRYEPAKLGVGPNTRHTPSKLSDVLWQKNAEEPRGMAERVISSTEKKMDPSPLPPASLHFGVEDSDSGSDDDSESSYSDNGDSLALRRTLRDQSKLLSLSSPLRAAGASSAFSNGYDDEQSGSEEGEEEDSSEGDDQSLDFLATARAVDPNAVRSREREYDAEVAERLAGDIPVGSSAATAGGGSGFNSPIDEKRADDEDDYEDEENDTSDEEGGMEEKSIVS